MPRKSLKNDILQYLRKNAGVRFSSDNIEVFARTMAHRKFNGETGRKRADDLFDEKLINRQVINKVRYYWVSEPKREVYGRVLAYDDQGLPFYRELTKEIW